MSRIMRCALAVILTALTGCSGAGDPPRAVTLKCPADRPDSPSIEWSADRPETERDLQVSWLTGRAAYEEAIDTLRAWEALWSQC